MEDNDLQEEVETQVEETETTEVEETESNDTPTLEDYEALKKKLKTIEAQKDHWRKKAETPKLESKQKETLQTNNEYLTRDEAVLLAKGYDEEDLAKLNMLANGKKLTEVANDEMFIAWKEKKDEKLKVAKAQLGSSKSLTTKTSKPVSEMTPEEHKAYWQSLQK